MPDTQARCGQCGAPLGEEDLKEGKCSECGWSLSGKKGP